MPQTQKEQATGYLDNNYYPKMTGRELAVNLNIPGRSARRYLREYRKRMEHLQPKLSLNVQPQFMNAVVFDIETTDFGTEGYSGYMVCCSFLPLHDDKVETLEIRFDDQRDDKRLVQEVARKLSQYTFHIGHNIAAFDYNWINSRLRYHRLPTLDTAFYFDTYQVFRSLAQKTRKNLGNLIDYFGLEGVKTTVYKTSWSKVLSPEESEFDDALDEIVEHCEYDVLANRELFHQIALPYCMTRGRVSPFKMSQEHGNYWKYQEVEAVGS